MADDTDGLETVATGAGLAVAGRIVKLVLALAIHVVMARLLGSSAYGGIVLAQVLVGLVSLIAKLGVADGLVRQIPLHEDETSRARGVVQAGLVTTVFAGGLAGLAVVVAAPRIAGIVFNDSSLTVLFVLAGLAIPVTVLTHVGVAIARGSRDARPHVIVRQLLDPVVQLTLVSVFIAAGFGAVGAMGAVVLAQTLTATVALGLAIRSLPFSLRGPAEPMYGQLLGFSLPLVLAAGMDFVVIHTDTFLLGALRSTDAVGVYNVVFQLRSMGLFFFYPIVFLLPPVLTRLQSRGEVPEARNIYRVASKWLVFTTTPIFLLVFLFPDTLITVTFGAGYTPGARALRILAIPVIVTSLLSANGAALVALGHNRSNLYVNGGAAVLNVLLNLLLIPRFGIVGAALASAAAYVGRDGVYTVLLYRWEGLQPFSAPMLKPLLATLPVVGLGYVAFVETVPVTPLTVFAVGIVFLVVYGPLVVLAGGLGPADEQLLVLLEDRAGVRLGPLRRGARRLR